MKLSAVAIASILGFAAANPTPLEKRATVQGFDISGYQPTVDFAGAYASGARFVIIKVRPNPHAPFLKHQFHKNVS